jgi:hypothetical protein
MRKTVRFLVISSVLSCGGDPVCVIPPCAFPVAIQVSVHTGTSQSGVVGAFVRASGTNDIPCAGGSAAPCIVPGDAGTYQLDVGAPGFQTVHRTVDVTGKGAAGCGTCPSVDTQHLDIALIPTT